MIILIQRNKTHDGTIFDVKTLESIFQQTQHQIVGKGSGLVVVASATDAFIEPIVLTLVSPTLPYLGTIRSLEDAQAVVAHGRQECVMCSLHVTSAEYITQRFQDMGLDEQDVAWIKEHTHMTILEDTNE